jgi:hypothetical protein
LGHRVREPELVERGRPQPLDDPADVGDGPLDAGPQREQSLVGHA